MPTFLTKLTHALAEIPQSLRPTPQPQIVMTLLVKNEEEMLAQNLEFHHRMGINAFIITDNNSTDRTPEIIQHYQQLGWVVEVIEEHATDYEQKRWVDRMVWLAKTKHHAQWVINADADEFWYAPGGSSLPQLLAQVNANVLHCEVRNMLPEANLPWTEWSRTVRAVPHPETSYGLSRFSLYVPQAGKVMHRTAGYLQISMGNHKVKMLPYRKADAGIIVYHYNIRSRQQFMQKMINGGQQLEQHKSKHGGRHWRYFYALYQESEAQLSAEYDRVIGTHALPALTQAGFVVNDCPLPEWFKNNLKTLE